jgi:hypothetical protein
MGVSLACAGDFAKGRAHFDRAIALHEPAEHRVLAKRSSVDTAVSILCYRSWTLWFLGHPDAALADSDRAISDAREIGQAATLLYALGHALFIYFECGNAKARVIVDELVALAGEKGTLFWKAQGMIHEGWLFALTGKAAGAIHKITSGLTTWRSTGAGVLIPTYLSCATRLRRTRPIR